MDLEFHYYITYLISIKAGFQCWQAYIIAYSSQYIDDNVQKTTIYDNNKNVIYTSHITQTNDITLKDDQINHIFPIFHFLPEASKDKGSLRKDNKTHKMDTKSGSLSARILIQAALTSNNLYWIGIAAHTFTDTWAHQNFTGTRDEYNAFPGFLSKIIPNIGHTDALHAPDEVGVIWHDPPINDPHIDNNIRFLDAAFTLFKIFQGFLNPNSYESTNWPILKKDLVKIWTKHKSNGFFKAAARRSRIKDYIKLAKEYSGIELIEYNQHTWKRDSIRSHITKPTSWQDKDNYKTKHWYLFQEASKIQHDFLRRFVDHNSKSNTTIIPTLDK